MTYDPSSSPPSLTPSLSFLPFALFCLSSLYICFFSLCQPGFDGTMQYWTENHQIDFHVGGVPLFFRKLIVCYIASAVFLFCVLLFPIPRGTEYLVGEYLHEEIFSNGNMTGAEHALKGKVLVEQWLHWRWHYGFSEFNSDTYAMVAIQPLIVLANFAPDAHVRTRAAMVMDLMVMDLMQYQHNGHLGGPRGRVYTRAKISIKNQSPRSFLWLVTGQGELSEMPGVHASSILLSLGANYRPPAVLLQIGQDKSDEITVSGRSSFDVADGPLHGFGYETPEDCLFWFGMAAYSHPLVAECMFIVGDAYSMWNHPVWAPLRQFRPFAGTGVIAQVTNSLYPITKGSALGEMNTYSYKTPDVHLSSMRNYNKGGIPVSFGRGGGWGGAFFGQTFGFIVQFENLKTEPLHHLGLVGIQQHVWQATLDDDALLWGTHPGPSDGDHSASYWTGGGSLPRVDQHESVFLPSPQSTFVLGSVTSPSTHSPLHLIRHQRCRNPGPLGIIQPIFSRARRCYFFQLHTRIFSDSTIRRSPRGRWLDLWPERRWVRCSLVAIARVIRRRRKRVVRSRNSITRGKLRPLSFVVITANIKCASSKPPLQCQHRHQQFSGSLPRSLRLVATTAPLFTITTPPPQTIRQIVRCAHQTPRCLLLLPPACPLLASRSRTHNISKVNIFSDSFIKLFFPVAINRPLQGAVSLDHRGRTGGDRRIFQGLSAACGNPHRRTAHFTPDSCRSIWSRKVPRTEPRVHGRISR
jgi:hypothetical protein